MRPPSSKTVAAATALALCAVAGTARADVQTFLYVGKVTYSATGEDGKPWASVGTRVTGQFTYDTSQAPAWESGSPGVDQQAGYRFLGPNLITAKVGNHLAWADDLDVTVTDNSGAEYADSVVLGGGRPAMLDGKRGAQSYLELSLASAWDQTGVLTGVGLPASYDVAAFNGVGGTYGLIATHGGAQPLVEFSIESITAPAPPAP